MASSSARSTGGLSPTGNSLDTICVIKGSQTKTLQSISWSYGSNGVGVNYGSSQYGGRIVVVDGAIVDPTALPGGVLAVGILPGSLMTSADLGPSGIAQFGGLVKFDLDLAPYNAGNAGSGQFIFPADTQEGALTTTAGPVSVVLFACHFSNTGGSGPALAVFGKLFVQFKENDDDANSPMARTYSYAPISPPMQ